MSDLIQRQDAIRAYCENQCGKGMIRGECGCDDCGTIFDDIPSAQPEWNNHAVACLLAEMFGDTCACNFNGIDEWLPEKCELIDVCPYTVGVACWEQFLTHRAERRTDG